MTSNAKIYEQVAQKRKFLGEGVVTINEDKIVIEFAGQKLALDGKRIKDFDDGLTDNLEDPFIEITTSFFVDFVDGSATRRIYVDVEMEEKKFSDFVEPLQKYRKKTNVDQLYGTYHVWFGWLYYTVVCTTLLISMVGTIILLGKLQYVWPTGILIILIPLGLLLPVFVVARLLRGEVTVRETDVLFKNFYMSKRIAWDSVREFILRYQRRHGGSGGFPVYIIEYVIGDRKKKISFSTSAIDMTKKPEMLIKAIKIKTSHAEQWVENDPNSDFYRRPWGKYETH